MEVPHFLLSDPQTVRYILVLDTSVISLFGIYIQNSNYNGDE